MKLIWGIVAIIVGFSTVVQATWTFVLTDFSNLYGNNFQQDQSDGGSMAAYYKSNNVAIFKSKTGAYWYSHFVPWNCNPWCACYNFVDNVRYIRFYVKNIMRYGGTLKAFFRSSLRDDCSFNGDHRNCVEEYYLVNNWRHDPVSGWEVGEVQVSQLKSVNKYKMIKMGFVELTPTGIDYEFHKITFESDCLKICPKMCSGQGSCSCSGTCSCNARFYGDDCSKQYCPSNCNGNGNCNSATGTCDCHAGWTGTDCRCRTCQSSNCNGRGTCNCDGKCSCNAGFWGDSCECTSKNCNNGVTNCDGSCSCYAGWREPECTCKTCKSNCNGRGTCNCDGTCSCNAGFWGERCECTAANCNGRGTNNCDGSCSCNAGFWGTNCQCISKNCNGRGTNNCDGTCTCKAGFWGPECSCILRECKNGGTLNCDGTCTCKPGFNGPDCGCIIKNCNNGVTNCDGSCSCYAGWRGPECTCKTCPANCNGQGTCNCDGTCSCNDGFWGSDCGCKYCPGSPPCSGQGTCGCSGQCLCGTGFLGTTCNCKTCPSDCNGMGTCNCDGTCTCKAGFWGSNCSCIWRDCKNGATLNCDGTCTCKPGFNGPDCGCITKNCNNGVTNCDGSCTCYAGWTGSNCTCKTCKANCNGKGTCNCDGTCTCNAGSWGPDCSCIYKNCNGKGTCNCDGTCSCNAGFWGSNCSCIYNNCNSGVTNCNGTCTCNVGTWGSDCSCIYKDCKNGAIVNCDGTCTCKPGFSGSDCSCIVKDCKNGATANCDGTCTCKPGFWGSDCSCIAKECKNGGNLNCDGTCTCKPGFNGADCSCISKNCNNGITNCDGNCTCNTGWRGSDCNCKTCPANCNGKGTCNCDGTCTCNAGFWGGSCGCTSCANNCSNNGACNCDGSCTCQIDFLGSSNCQCKTRVSGTCKNGDGTYNCATGKCNCLPGYSGDLCDCSTVCYPVCINGGSCRCDNTCDCPVDWRGAADCSCKTRVSGTCPYGTGKYICETGHCECQAGWSGPNCDCPLNCQTPCKNGGICKCGTCECPAEWRGSADCSCKTPILGCVKGTGKFDCATGNCECQAGWSGPKCDCNNLGCRNDCSGNGVCGCDGNCTCSDEWKSKSDCSCKTPIGQCYHAVDPPYSYVCATGFCNCSAGWSGPLCDCKTTCLNSCSGHGQCDCGTCQCDPEWRGSADCSCKTPVGLCVNGNGTYDCKTGNCICYPGWSGPNCECPTSCPNDCSNHGNCTCGTCKCDVGWTKAPDCSCRNPVNPGNPCVSGLYNCSTGLCDAVCQNNNCSVACLNSAGSKGCNCLGICNCLDGFYGANCECRNVTTPCSNGGSPQCDGSCKCPIGYSGTGCENKNCPPNCINSYGCNYSNGSCLCNSGYYGDFCEKKECPYPCLNGGICSTDGKCVCPTGFESRDCSYPSCSLACISNVGSKGCDANGTCLCYDNFYGPLCSNKRCAKPCLNGGFCSNDGICTCPQTYAGIQCEIDRCLDNNPYYPVSGCNASTNQQPTTTVPPSYAEASPTSNVLAITKFRDLYVNDLGYDQGATFSQYFRSDHGAYVTGEVGKSWFCRLAQQGSYFSVKGFYNYLRFEAQGFLAIKGTFTVMLKDASMNEEYQLMQKWVIDPDTGNEISEINLNYFYLVNPERLTMIGMFYLQPVNASFMIKSVYLDSESKIRKIENRYSTSISWTTSNAQTTINGVNYTWIVVGVVVGVVAISAAVIGIYYKKRSSKINYLRATQLSSQQDLSMKVMAGSSTQITTSPSMTRLTQASQFRSDSSLFSYGDMDSSIMTKNSTSTFTRTGSSVLAVPGYLQIRHGKDYSFTDNVIARGGTSQIFKGRILNEEMKQKYGFQEIAVKVLNETEASESFYYELAIMNNIRMCDNVVKLVGYTDYPKRIIMKYYPYSLKTFITQKGGYMNHLIALKISIDIFRGLSFLHESMILHLDLKPQNILFDVRPDDTFTCVICDFGFANIIGDSKKKRKVVSGLQIPTAAGITARYAAPELFEKLEMVSDGRLNSEVDKKIDIFAAAMTIFELITGCEPWKGIADYSVIKTKVRKGERPMISDTLGIVLDVRQNAMIVINLIEKCWQGNPQDRPNSKECLTVLLQL